eukprot:scaffold20417_cov76-Phaeocystis_antarctica.AAC.1
MRAHAVAGASPPPPASCISVAISHADAMCSARETGKGWRTTATGGGRRRTKTTSARTRTGDVAAEAGQRGLRWHRNGRPWWSVAVRQRWAVRPVFGLCDCRGGRLAAWPDERRDAPRLRPPHEPHGLSPLRCDRGRESALASRCRSPWLHMCSWRGTDVCSAGSYGRRPTHRVLRGHGSMVYLGEAAASARSARLYRGCLGAHTVPWREG